MKTKLLTIAMTTVLMLTAMTKVQAQNYEGPCLPSSHGLTGHQSAFCGSILTQTIALSAGWNWISSYIEMNGVDGLDMLKESLGANGLYIQNGLLYTESWEEDGETFWYGSLDEVPMTNETMYMVQVAADCTLTLTGDLADPAAHPITINPGWNWIGFPCNQTMSIENAFANFPVADGDAIMYGISYSDAFIDGDDVIWYGGITQLEPGQGFMYYSTSTQPKTLIYSTTSGGKSVFLLKQKE